MPILTWEEINGSHRNTLYFHFSQELLELLKSDNRYRCTTNKASPLTIAIYANKRYGLYNHSPSIFVNKSYVSYHIYTFVPSQCKECGGSLKNTTALGQVIVYCPRCLK